MELGLPWPFWPRKLLIQQFSQIILLNSVDLQEAELKKRKMLSYSLVEITENLQNTKIWPFLDL